MATKKQKREAALAKRERFLAQERELGRRAIEAAKKERDALMLAAWSKQHETHYKFNDDCPHCAKIKKEQQSVEGDS